MTPGQNHLDPAYPPAPPWEEHILTPFLADPHPGAGMHPQQAWMEVVGWTAFGGSKSSFGTSLLGSYGDFHHTCPFFVISLRGGTHIPLPWKGD